MTTSRARVLFDAQIHDVINAGIKQGDPNSPIRDLFELKAAGLKVYGETRSGIAPSTTISYNLTDGSLLDGDHAGIVFASIQLIVVRNRRTDALANLTVGPHPTAGFGILGAGLGWWPAATGSGGGSVIAASSLWYKNDRAGAPVVDATANILAVITSAVADSDNAFDIILAGPGV